MIRCLRTARSARSRPGCGQDRLLARAALDEPLGLEPLQHLAGRGARHAEHLGDARGECRMRRCPEGGTRRSGTPGSRSSRGIRRPNGLEPSSSHPSAGGGLARPGRATARRLSAWGRSSTRCTSSATSSPSVRWELPRARARALLRAARACAAFAWRVDPARLPIPDERLPLPQRLRRLRGGVGVNSIAPARAGDAVKLYLIKHRIAGASYATLAPTLLAETLLDVVRRGSADGLGACDRRPADPPGLLAAAVGRLGLLRPLRAARRRSASPLVAGAP